MLIFIDRRQRGPSGAYSVELSVLAIGMTAKATSPRIHVDSTRKTGSKLFSNLSRNESFIPFLRHEQSPDLCAPRALDGHDQSGSDSRNSDTFARLTPTGPGETLGK